MTTIAADNAVTQKTQELCQTLLDQPGVQSALQRINAFLGDDGARGQYDALMAKGETLQQKQQSGAQITEVEIAEFERDRQALVNNPVARGFLEAQEEMNQVRQTVVHYVTKSFELGRVPTPDDFESCGHGCGCSH